MTPPANLVQVRGLGKSYAAPVLVDFDFDLRPGEVHTLVGANGAGKSTFVRALAGLTPHDTGAITLDGRPFQPRSRHDAEAAGVVIVLQELNILPTLTVAENLFLDRLPRRLGWVRRAPLRAAARTALDRVGLRDLDPDTPAGALGVGEHQLLEIAAALDRRCRVLILDEPTAALTGPEIDRLFSHLRGLQAAGVGILYITHRMDEIARLGGRVSVLRDGRRIQTREAAATSPAELLRDMSGDTLSLSAAHPPPAAGAVALRVENLTRGPRLRGASFSVRRGEVLGIAGLIGSGRTELLRAIFGADTPDSGTIHLGEAAAPVRVRNPRTAIEHGIGLVPEDRKHDGLLLSLSIADNVTLSILPAQSGPCGWITPARVQSVAAPACAQVGVVCASLDQPCSELSGGNQQKVVLARWLLRDATVLLVDEPTRGIDTPTKARVHRLLRELAAQGKAVVAVSSETPELFALCDRLLVMSAGRIVTELPRSEWTEASVLQAAFSGYLTSPSTS